LKKLGIIFMALVLALGYYAMPTIAGAAEVSAKDDSKVTLSGQIRIRGEFDHNLRDQSGDSKDENAAGKLILDDHAAFYDTQVRVGIEAKVAEGVTGKIQLETESADNAGNDTYLWGSGSAGARGTYPRGNSKRGSLNIREAYIDYNKDIFQVTVGHQEFKQFNGLFFDHTKYGDDGIKVFVRPNKNVTVLLETIKLNEGVAHSGTANASTSSVDDSDAYILFGQYKGDTFKIGGAVDYVNDQNPGWADGAIHLFNYALAGDVSFGPVTLRGDFELQSGEFKQAAGASNDVRIDAYAGLLGADYTIGDTKITLEGAFGSGDDNKETKRSKGFITALGADQHYTFVYEYKGTASTGMTGTGLTNTEYIKFGASTKFAKDFSAEAYLYWLHAVEAVSLHGDSPSSNLGYEMDAKVTYQIATNLKYYVEGGYMAVGNAYNYVSQPDHAADNMYAVRHGIQLNF